MDSLGNFVFLPENVRILMDRFYNETRQLMANKDAMPQDISLIERGINSPTIRTVVKLAGVLKVAPSKIAVKMEELMAGAKE
jgi:transcriptional regulator with XRE-family HTH domain